MDLNALSLPNGWQYEHTPDDSARFVLGTDGDNPLICVGVNPSKATPHKLDPTVERVKRRAARTQHDSWIMLNLYPQRSTDPTGMHKVELPGLRTKNELHISRLLRNITRELGSVSLLAAWGGVITTRDYLPGMLRGIADVAEDLGCDWLSIGAPLKDGGHPRHPSRASYDTALQPFDMASYLRKLKA